MEIYRSTFVTTAFQVSSPHAVNTLYSGQLIVASNKDSTFGNGSNYNNLDSFAIFCKAGLYPDTEIAFKPLV